MRKTFPVEIQNPGTIKRKTQLYKKLLNVKQNKLYHNKVKDKLEINRNWKKKQTNPAILRQRASISKLKKK